MFPDVDPADVALALSDAGDQIEAAVRIVQLDVPRAYNICCSRSGRRAQ
jgi:hypothetical protein